MLHRAQQRDAKASSPQIQSMPTTEANWEPKYEYALDVGDHFDCAASGEAALADATAEACCRGYFNEPAVSRFFKQHRTDCGDDAFLAAAGNDRCRRSA